MAKTVAIFAAKSAAVDVLCYDHPTTYMQMVAGGWLHPIDAIWNDPGVWKLYAPPTKKGLTAPDGKIYGSIGQVKTMMLFYRPSVVSKPPATWTELQGDRQEGDDREDVGLRLLRGRRDGHRLSAPRHDLLAGWPDG